MRDAERKTASQTPRNARAGRDKPLPGEERRKLGEQGDHLERLRAQQREQVEQKAELLRESARKNLAQMTNRIKQLREQGDTAAAEELAVRMKKMAERYRATLAKLLDSTPGPNSQQRPPRPESQRSRNQQENWRPAAQPRQRPGNRVEGQRRPAESSRQQNGQQQNGRQQNGQQRQIQRQAQDMQAQD